MMVPMQILLSFFTSSITNDYIKIWWVPRQKLTFYYILISKN